MKKYVISGLIAVGLAGFIVWIQTGDTLPGNSPGMLASLVLNESEQVAGAWNEYLKDHQNNPPATSADLIGPNGYISQIPSYPAYGSTGQLEMVISKNNGHYFAYADMGLPHRKSVAGTAADPNAIYCDIIIKTAVMVKGADTTGPGITGDGIMTTAAPGTIYNSNGAVTPTSGNGTFGCAYTNASTGNTVGGMAIPAGHYVMEYLLQ